VLIILPPSESKRDPPSSGRTLALDELSFPELTLIRRRVLEALVITSGSPDALARLRVRPTLVEEVARNTVIDEIPTRPAKETYTGPLHAGLDAASLMGSAKRRLDTDVVINSALWGLVRPGDRIPAYRLHVCTHLVGLDDLEPLWRTALPQVLAQAARDKGVVLDLRSPTYQATGTPAKLGTPTVTLRVVPEAGGKAIGDVTAKRVRGEVARYLLESAAKPVGPDDLADVLGERWPIRVDPPDGPSKAWTIRLRPGD
jgi:uncharacterized protein